MWQNDDSESLEKRKIFQNTLGTQGLLLKEKHNFIIRLMSQWMEYYCLAVFCLNNSFLWNKYANFSKQGEEDAPLCYFACTLRNIHSEERNPKKSHGRGPADAARTKVKNSRESQEAAVTALLAHTPPQPALTRELSCPRRQRPSPTAPAPQPPPPGDTDPSALGSADGEAPVSH